MNSVERVFDEISLPSINERRHPEHPDAAVANAIADL
jgi:hypothetical protein